MAFSYKEYTTRSSGQREFTFAFDAVAKDTTNIKVTIGGKHLYDGVSKYNTSTRALDDTSGSVQDAEYTVSTGSIIIKSDVSFTVGNATIASGVPTLSASVPLRIYRETNRNTAEVTFSSGSILADSDLNKANNQGRFLALEAVDRADESMSIDPDDSTQYDIQISGSDKRIFGVADPNNTNDAANKAYVDGVAMGSGANIVTTDGSQTLTAKTLTSPVIGTKISDTNDKELVNLTATTDAVNEFTIANAATGNAPTLSATGDDANVDIKVSPKGTGEVVIGTGSASGKITSNGAYDLVLDTNSGSDSGSITITDGADGSIDITPNGTGLVEIGTNLAFKNITGASTQTNKILIGHSGQSNDKISFANSATPDNLILSIDDQRNVTIESDATLDTSAGSLTTSAAQKQAIVQAGPGSGTLDVSSGTLTTSDAQKQAIVDGATIEAQDLASGSGTTLPNNVQDAITRLGTVTSGTFEGALSTNTTGGGAMAVGAVSQSSGTPTGDIITRGSTANGEYVRYADGTQICVIRNISPSTSSDVTWTFPAAFASGVTPTTAGTSTGNDQTSEDRIATNGSTALSNTAWKFRLWNLGGGSSYPSRSALDTNLSAIGRWF